MAQADYSDIDFATIKESTGLEVDEIVDVVLRVLDQPEVVRFLNSRRSPNVRLARRSGQAKEDPVEPLAVQLARARPLPRKSPKHMLTKTDYRQLRLMSGDELICGSTIRCHHEPIQDR